MTFTKEQLQHIIETDHVQCGDASALARMALAGMEAEPVAWAHRLINKRNGVVHPWVYGSAEACPSEGDIFNIEVMPLYTAPPAPVSVPAAMEMDDDFDSAFEHGKAVGWNACRAAMLQGEPTDDERIMAIEGIIPAADEHVRYESNAGGNLWVQCSKQKYEKMKLAGMLTRVLYERPQNQQQNIPENIPNLREAVKTIRNSGIAIDGEKILAERDDLNSPVVPDGWVLVPVEPTDEMLHALYHCGTRLIRPFETQLYQDMLTAAPQQEVTQALVKGMERYGDAMQKLADSGD
nr:MAG TPA: hypothetical protein [Caudoviricetes sp.]